MSLNSFVNPCISLPVVKYSFSTALNSAAGRFAWEHVHNVVIVFDSFRNNARPSSCPSRCLKVVDGTKTLELCDIEAKAIESRAVVEKAKTVGIQLKTEQLPSMAIWHSINRTMAIRYSLADDHTRRIQVRFKSDQDFKTALTVLGEIGLPLFESTSQSRPPTQPTPARIATGSDPAQSISSPFFTASEGEPRPATSIGLHTLPERERIPSSSNGIFTASTESAFTPVSETRSTPSGFFTTSESHYVMNGPLRGSSLGGPPSARVMPPAPPLTPRPRSATSGRAWCPPTARPYTALPTIVENDRVASTSSRISGDLDFRHMDNRRPYTTLTPRPLTPLRLDIHSDPVAPRALGLDIMKHTLASQIQSPLQDLSGCHAVQNKPAEAQPRPKLNSLPPVPPFGAIRPSTAPTSGFASGLEDMIPPRRELPFKRRSTSSSGNQTGEGPSRPSSSTTNMPPLKKPTLAQKGVPSPVAAEAKKSTSRATGRARKPTKRSQETANPPGPPIRSDSNGSTFEALRAPPSDEVQPKPQQQSRPATALIELPSPFLHNSGISFAAEPTNLPSSSTGPSMHSGSATAQPMLPAGSANTHPVDDCFAALSGIVPQTQPRTHDKENLASYVSLPFDERKTVLENAIIECIQDDGFKQLCEDMYGVWQRIGFGV